VTVSQVRFFLMMTYGRFGPSPGPTPAAETG
jgi:hypothetical protein